MYPLQHFRRSIKLTNVLSNCISPQGCTFSLGEFIARSHSYGNQASMLKENHTSTLLHNEEPLTEFQKARLKAEDIESASFIASYIQRKGTKYLNKVDLEYLKSELRFNSMEELRSIVRNTKRIMLLKPIGKEIKAYVRFLLHQEVFGQDNHSMEHGINMRRELISDQSNTFENIHPLHFQKLQEQIQRHFYLSRSQSYNILVSEIRNAHRKRITKSQRRQVQDVVETYMNDLTKSNGSIQCSTHEYQETEGGKNMVETKISTSEEFDLFAHISNICKLLNEIPIPHVLKYALVYGELQKITRHQITIDHYALINNYLEMYKEDITSQSISTICDKLEKLIPISRQHIYNVVLGELQKKERRILQPKIKEDIRIRFRELHNQNIDISTITSDIVKKFHVSKLQAYRQVRLELQRMNRNHVSNSHMELIRKTVSKNQDLSTQELCDRLESNMDLPRFLLYDSIKKEKEKMLRKEVNREHRATVRNFLEENAIEINTADVKTLCDKLKYVNIPRTILYKVITVELQKMKRMNITKTQKVTINKIVLSYSQEIKNETITISEICDEVMKLVHLPRKQVYERVWFQVQKLK